MESLIYIKTDHNLSPKHIAFNKLISTIEKLRAEIGQDEQKLQTFNDYFTENIFPLDQKLRENKVQMVIALDNFSEKGKLPKSTLDDISIIIINLLHDLIATSDIDDQLIAIFNKWSDESYQELLDAEKEDAKDELRFFFDSMGVDMDLSDIDLDDPTTFSSIFEKMQEANSMGEAFFNDFKANKKKTKKQLAAEEMQIKQDEIKNKNLRSVYMSLVKCLHPDAETDLDLKIKKEEIMKSVTKAYEEKDIITLLMLESEWIKETNDRLTTMNEDVVGVYIQILKDQVKKLRQEKNELKSHPRYERIAYYANEKLERGLLSLSGLKLLKEKYVRQMKGDLDVILNQDHKSVKKFIKSLSKSFHVEEQPKFDFFDFDDF